MIKHIHFYLFSVLLFITMSFQNFVHSQIIPDDRRIEWNVGFITGIPELESPIIDITQYGADKTGNIASNEAFTKALQALPVTGGILYFPAGTYKFTRGIVIAKSDIVIRGDGSNATRLLFDTNDGCITIKGVTSKNWQNISNGYTKNSKTLTITDTKSFVVGKFAEIQMENDSAIMFTDPKWNVSWANNSVGQIFQIENISGNEITFATPLHINYKKELNPQIRPLSLVTKVGIENLYIEKLRSSDVNTILIENAAYCWVKNIESYHTLRTHVHISESYRCEVRGSYFHHSFDYGGGGHGYGVECNHHSSNVLVEDNIFDSLRHAMMVQVGATGNVFGYNYSTHPVQGDGEKNLNNGWTPPDISIHGHYPYMNLFEGNDVYEIGIADYWGPAGVGNTYFRNKVKGEGIFYYDQSHYQNLLANETTKITDSDGKSKNKLEHGNIVSGKIIWNSSIPQRELPASLYLHNQPKFLDKCIIPFYGPDNPEKQKLPAQIRYEDIIKNAKLNPRADIKFEIKLNNKPLQGAIIKLNNDSLQTTIDGISTFYDRPAGTLYSFKISKAGYNEIIGSFSLKADTTLVIALVNTFVENNHIENTVEIFPTPVRDYLKYKTTFDYRLLEILDISGKLVYRIDNQSSDSDLNVSFLEPGLYFLRFTGDEIYQQQSKFIKL